MTCPGGRVRAIAARLCNARTMALLIDPVLADLQAEYRHALASGRVWKSRWVLMTGYVSFLKVIAVYGCERSMRTLGDWTADDRQALERTIGFSAAAIAAVTLLLFLPQIASPAPQYLPTHLLVFSVPQGLPIAIPVGYTLGIFCVLGGRVLSARLQVAVLGMALAGSFASFTTTAWISPAAGEAFRVSVARHLQLTQGAEFHLTKGPNELTLRELSQQIDLHSRAGRAQVARRLASAYHMRWALPCATFALALFALSAMPRRPVGRWILGIAAVATCVANYALWFSGEILARQGTLPVVAAIWIPNAVFVVASATLLMIASYRSGGGGVIEPATKSGLG